MRLTFLLAAAACAAASGCGLFFDDVAGTGGGGTAATTTTTSAAGGAGGSGGAPDCSARVGDDDQWLLGYAQASVAGVARGDGRIWVLGAAQVGVSGGVPLGISGLRLFLLSTDPNGCDVALRDLGSALESGAVAGLDLAERDEGVPLVTISRQRRVCTFAADVDPIPNAQCQGNALFSCSSDIRATEGVVSGLASPVLALKASGQLTCSSPGVSFGVVNDDNAIARTRLIPFDADLRRKKAAPGAFARFGGICGLMSPSCPLGDPKIFRLEGGSFTSITIPAPQVSFAGAEGIVIPTRTSFVAVGTQSPTLNPRRFVAFGDPAAPSFFHDEDGDAVILGAVDGADGTILAGGSAASSFGSINGTDPIGCPNGQPTCDQFGFWARLDPATDGITDHDTYAAAGSSCPPTAGATALAADDQGIFMALDVSCGRLVRPYGESPEYDDLGGFVLVREAF